MTLDWTDTDLASSQCCLAPAEVMSDSLSAACATLSGLAECRVLTAYKDQRCCSL